MFKKIRKLTESKNFQNFVTGVILIASVLVGLETYPGLYQSYRPLFHSLDLVIQAIFTLEITLRILAHGRSPFGFFRSGQNLFDFLITVLFYLPFGGAYVSIFRLVRIFRIFRLFTALPQLQIMVGALISGVPSMGYITLLLLIQFYIFAVIGVSQFGVLDPANFGNLGQTMMTLFQVVTLEGWVDIYKGLGSTAAATIYFVVFILTGTMIILNLFIGVITSGFDDVKREVEESSEGETEKLETDLKNIKKNLAALTLVVDKAIKKSRVKKN